jgi:hypothetical protein
MPGIVACVASRESAQPAATPACGLFFLMQVVVIAPGLIEAATAGHRRPHPIEETA